MDNYTPKTDLIPIGSIAKSFGISDNTIRRMEAAGLLTPAKIKESGYRYYDSHNIFRIKTILTLRNFGLVYEDMREFFNSSGDFTIVYDKLYEKKLAIDNLLSQARRHIKPEDASEIFIIPHIDIPFFSVSYEVPCLYKAEVLEEITSKTIHDAAAGKYPIDFSRPLTIETECMDFTEYDPYAPQKLRVLVPLREKIDNSETDLFPSRKVLSLAYFPGLSYTKSFKQLKAYMEAHNLRQSNPLAITYEFGRHVIENVDTDKFLFHIMIPVEEI